MNAKSNISPISIFVGAVCSTIQIVLPYNYNVEYSCVNRRELELTMGQIGFEGRLPLFTHSAGFIYSDPSLRLALRPPSHSPTCKYYIDHHHQTPNGLLQLKHPQDRAGHPIRRRYADRSPIRRQRLRRLHRAIWGADTIANRHAAASRLLEKWQSCPNDTFHVLKCLDSSSSGTLMGICIWEEVPPAQSREEFLQEDAMTHCNWLSGHARKVARAYLVDGLYERWNVMQGQPHLHLMNLCTHPRHRRKGVATRLVRWGLELAKKRNVPAYCEESDMSHALYLRLGFREVSLVRSMLEGELFGTCPVMVKYPDEDEDEGKGGAERK